eukprot:Clim_evm28s203 gene=Clim_evmTU28s203
MTDDKEFENLQTVFSLHQCAVYQWEIKVESGAEQNERNIFILTMGQDENRFNSQRIEEMNKCLDYIQNTQALGVLVVTGNLGHKFFNNGVDLKEAVTHGPNRQERMLNSMLQLMARVLAFPLPTIAAINGHCFGAGCLFSLCFDERVMNSTKGYMCIPLLPLGIPAGKAFVALARAKLRSDTLTDVIFRAKRYTATTALEAGMVNEVCEGNALWSTAISMAKRACTHAVYPNYNTYAELKKEFYERELDLLMYGNNIPGTGGTMYNIPTRKLSRL